MPVPPHRSFVALGDSFTEGLFDVVGADGRHLGWADRAATALAAAIPEFRYANLAVRGKLLDEVVADQLPAAVEFAPDLVSFHAGGNDVLRPRTDLGDLAARYDAAVAQLRATGAEVVLFTVIERAGGTSRFADGLARRIAAFNGRVVRPSAQRHDATLVDVGAVRALHDRRLWFEDRLHLDEAGHRRVAAAVLEALGVDDPTRLGGDPGWWRVPLDAAPAAPRAQVVADDLRWVRRHLAPWVSRRVRGVSSGDTVVSKRPQLSDPGVPPAR